MKNSRNKGSAILTALFIMILVSIAATAMSLRLQIDINRTQLIQNISTLKSFAEEGEKIMINQLIKNSSPYSKDKKQNIDPIPFTLKATNNKLFKREVVLTDLQSKFNLNGLKNSGQLKPFTLLILALMPKLSKEEAFYIALFTQEWISKENQRVTNVTTEKFYANLKTPYLPTHKPFTSLSEWRLIKGVTQTIFNHLSLYLTALPIETPINLNTAPSAVLKTLGNGLTEVQSKNIIKIRGQDGFKTLNEALNNPEIKKMGLDIKNLTLTSDYFLITSSVSNEESQLVLYTTVKREIKKKGVRISVLQQTLNTY